jgi:hypothetical protein
VNVVAVKSNRSATAAMRAHPISQNRLWQIKQNHDFYVPVKTLPMPHIVTALILVNAPFMYAIN